MLIAVQEQELTYELLATYLGGYLAGIGEVTGKALYRNIIHWHMRQRREFTPMPWHSYIRSLHKEASEKMLCNLLLDDVETYFKQNPNWQEEEDIALRIWFDDVEDE